MTPRRAPRVRLITALWAAVSALALVPPLAAQEVEEARARGLSAYRAMDYEGAARALRRALSVSSDAVPAAVRAEILAYLGAAEAWRGRKVEAATAFRDALEVSPRFRLDTLTFPPAITAAFEEVRVGTEFVDIAAASDTLLQLGRDRARFVLHVSAPHAVRVDICSPDGAMLRRIHDGTVADSAVAMWDGMDARRSRALTGTLALCTESESVAGITRRLLKRLEIDVLADPSTEPVRVVRRPLATRTIITGVVAGLITAALPALVSNGEQGSDGRYLMGGALVGASVVAARFPRAPLLRDSVTVPARPRGPTRIRILVRPPRGGGGA